MISSIVLSLLLSLLLFGNDNCSDAFQHQLLQLTTTTTKYQAASNVVSKSSDPMRRRQNILLLSSADIDNEEDNTGAGDSAASASSLSLTSGKVDAIPRPRVNEVDFCMAPADSSLVAILSNPSSPSMGMSGSGTMTRYLNNASNRAIRRILLSKSWPSPESFNESLRKSLANKMTEKNQKKSTNGGLKMPTPLKKIRLMNKPQRSDEQYIQDQLSTFKSLYYGTNDGGYYASAEAYLGCVLSLATSGMESTRVQEVLQDGVPYQESYRRLLLVLERVGVQWMDDDSGRRKIAPKLLDDNICLSMLDSLSSETRSSSNASAGREKGFLLAAANDNLTNTRQLNILSNIVQRTLLFGGDDELLVLAETLEDDYSIFEKRYPEKQDGFAYYQALIQLLRMAYEKGSISPDDDTIESSLSNPYANAFERLTGNCVEFGSGYFFSTSTSNSASSTGADSSAADSSSSADLVEALSTKSLPIPKSPVEELGRFALWETKVRGALSSEDSNTEKLPKDLVGDWQIQEDVGGKVLFPNQPSIRINLQADGTVVLADDASVSKNDKMIQGLNWRLDPGPTHLDTCTFQVLAGDNILLYRGFLDRGARLEARFSKRPLSIKGKVQLQLRRDDVKQQERVPINYQSSMTLTNFVMSQIKKKEKKG
eukprot:CAMPEP_0178902382 /NCGR_PEP_ID=MMETSP0786-20121207/4571_1 /TAXON_ID=186022 /ORGANISM="Thalassionema frauenfeldii, Strain CCMP 1798" /LENGTH=654 /DNA_ID=CAMNT_0020573637 /DNA_START=39 /DNA_END=2003 /DNA_ORIENTATION=+